LHTNATAAATAATAATAAAAAPSSPPSGLHFGLSLQKTAAAAPQAPPLLALPTSSGLRFTLPQMRALPQSENGGMPMRSTTTEAGNRMLKAGYIVGGHQGSQEIMRLNGIVENLQHKLKMCGDRLSTTEQSVARGNAALQSERATSHARAVVLSGQVRDAQTREASVRSEMASLPRVSDYDQGRFEMQTQGALQLEQRYEEEVARVAALEEVLGGLRLERETATAEHATLQTQLESAKEAAEEAECTGQSLKHEALTMVNEAEARTDALLAEHAKAALEVSTAAQAGAADLENLKTALEEARTELQSSHQAIEAESIKSAEADLLIKSLDLKLNALRDEARQREEADVAAPIVDVAPTVDVAVVEVADVVVDVAMTKAVDDTIVDAFERYYKLKRVAETAVGAPDGAHHHALALRAYGALISGTVDHAMVLSCCVDDAFGACPDEEALSTQTAARQSLRTSLPASRLSGTHRDTDCLVDLTGVAPAITGTSTDTTPLGLKIRTDEYVAAVSKDLRRSLIHASRQWITASGGALPPMPPEAVLNGPGCTPVPPNQITDPQTPKTE